MEKYFRYCLIVCKKCCIIPRYKIKRWTMKNTRKSNKLLKLTAMFAFPCALFGGALVGSANFAQADETPTTYHYEEKNVTNPTFEDGVSGAYLEGNSLSGWTVTEDTKNLPGTGMIIDVGSKSETGDGETEYSKSVKGEGEKFRIMTDKNPRKCGGKCLTEGKHTK